MTTINPWINFNGNAYEAFSFYKNVFGGEFKKTVQFKDIASEAYPVSAEEGEKYLKIVLPIGNGSELIGNDVPSLMGKTNERENRSKIVVNADNKESCEKIFIGLSQDGEVEIPFQIDESGSCFAMFRDKYGIEWVIEFDENK